MWAIQETPASKAVIQSRGCVQPHNPAPRKKGQTAPATRMWAHTPSSTQDRQAIMEASTALSDTMRKYTPLHLSTCQMCVNQQESHHADHAAMSKLSSTHPANQLWSQTAVPLNGHCSNVAAVTHTHTHTKHVAPLPADQLGRTTSVVLLPCAACHN